MSKGRVRFRISLYLCAVGGGSGVHACVYASLCVRLVLCKSSCILETILLLKMLEIAYFV